MRSVVLRRLVAIVVAAATVVAAVALVAWHVSGGSWLRVDSPSMGRQAPVGSLLWVKPTNISELEVGDFVSFHPPNRPEVTISHLVLTVHPDGTLSTGGVIPGADPWTLSQGDLIGEVSQVWWGVGSLLQALPLLAAGLLLILLLRRVLPERWRDPVTLVAASMVLSAALVVYRPLVNAAQVAHQLDGSSVSLVGTGLLPTKITGPGGESVVVASGRLSTLALTPEPGTRQVELTLHAAIGWWWWLLLLAVCLLPSARLLIRTWWRDRRSVARGGGVCEGEFQPAMS